MHKDMTPVARNGGRGCFLTRVLLTKPACVCNARGSMFDKQRVMPNPGLWYNSKPIINHDA